ncbi:hypothetical protein Tco_0254549, partial [Tanacetum coccineum]
MAEQWDKSLNSLASAASLHISETKVWVNLNAGKTHALRLGCLALNDSSIFLDREGGSLAKSFSVVEGKYNFPDFTANFEPLYGSSIIISCLTCEVMFCGSSTIGMAEQRDKSLNSLASAASLHISKMKVWVNLIAGKTPALRPGCLALNDSSIFLDR